MFFFDLSESGPTSWMSLRSTFPSFPGSVFISTSTFPSFPVALYFTDSRTVLHMLHCASLETILLVKRIPGLYIEDYHMASLVCRLATMHHLPLPPPFKCFLHTGHRTRTSTCYIVRRFFFLLLLNVSYIQGIEHVLETSLLLSPPFKCFLHTGHRTRTRNITSSFSSF